MESGAEKGVSFIAKDPRVRMFVVAQLLVIFFFILSTSFLLYLAEFNIWRKTQLPGASGQHVSLSFTTRASDIWFALGSITTIDAFWIAATFNRTLMKNWHYFISLRMMALASLISVVFYLRENGSTEGCISRYPAVSLLMPCTLYFVFCFALPRLHRPPPVTAINAHFGSIHIYSKRISQSSIRWKTAIWVASVIGIFPVLLTLVIPQNWTTIIPLLAIGFEVSMM